jgi:hypothetical protein
MAQRGQKDLLGRLADAGEEALTRLSQTPGADRFMHVVTNMRDQVDALGSKVRGMEGLEKRVDALEREVRKLSKPSTGRSSSPARKSTTTTSRKTSSSASSGSRKKSGSTRKK